MKTIAGRLGDVFDIGEPANAATRVVQNWRSHRTTTPGVISERDNPVPQCLAQPATGVVANRASTLHEPDAMHPYLLCKRRKTGIEIRDRAQRRYRRNRCLSSQDLP